MFYLYKKISSSILVCFMIISSTVPLYAYEVILGGHSIGISLNYNGVIINGMYDIKHNDQMINQKDYGFKENDLIIGVNDISIKSIQDLSVQINHAIDNHQDIYLNIKRNHHTIKKKLNVVRDGEQYMTGLYVKDGIQGIGTMTYYDNNNQTYRALGHIMKDESPFLCQKGSIYYSSITKIIPSQSYKPGEKIGIKNSEFIGTVEKNTYSGLYGHYDKLPQNIQYIDLGTKDDVHKGEAYFYTVLNGNKPVKCKINITHINSYNSKIKNFTFEITDKKVLDLSNGIVQGMSGSPIVQDNLLVGAITHVFLNNPTKGYGIFIENMPKVMQ